MSRTPARVTQADVARAIRAAKQAGAAGVEIRADGSMYVHLSAPRDGGKSPAEAQKALEDDQGVVL
jgi:hypothetical protein